MLTLMLAPLPASSPMLVAGVIRPEPVWLTLPMSAVLGVGEREAELSSSLGAIAAAAAAPPLMERRGAGAILASGEGGGRGRWGGSRGRVVGDCRRGKGVGVGW